MLIVDPDNNKIIVEQEGERKVFDISSPEAFTEISKVFLRCGWDSKYVYSFSWLGRPIIQLPDDLLRLQEVIYSVKPDVIIDIGVAHGGSLIFSASLCHAIGKGKVIGVDIDIRAHNRKAIEDHKMSEYITLIEGDSVEQNTLEKVASQIKKDDLVMVCLDGCHTREHVLKELNAYSKYISDNSYIIAMDGIMKDLVGAPRASDDWDSNNPYQAALDFVKDNPEFIIEEPIFPFNEGNIINREPTYWPKAFIRRKKIANNNQCSKNYVSD